ncbi:uncharacterized protein B4U79_18820 [Dinothrombium tinctorium]|uniref:Uncharacterized protein n=1 Tax=Dinothrombium tinctorium TaxID=1965070 RepID=A0A3S3PWV7_9ACAR|nr:uncharacterized protein B4U79_18820 [Dinothrombium tinctorium]
MRQLKYAVKTRWYSYVEMLQSVTRNKNVIWNLALNDNLRNATDKKFWEKVYFVIAVLKPITNAIAEIKGDKTFLSSVVVSYKRMKALIFGNIKPFTTTEQTQIQNILNQRENFLLHPIHYLGNILDPNFEGKSLDENEHQSALRLLQQCFMQLEFSSENILAFQNVSAKEGQFKPQFFELIA